MLAKFTDLKAFEFISYRIQFITTGTLYVYYANSRMTQQTEEAY